MLTNTKIHEIYQEMQRRNSILPNAYPGYYINLNEKLEIELSGKFGHLFSIPTNQLSDIHAILQLCHPDTPYYIYHDIYLSEELPGISLYSYQHAPNILTTQPPVCAEKTIYTVQPTNISHTIVQPNEPITDAIKRVHALVEQSFAFVHQYPHINMDNQQLHSPQKIPLVNDINISINAYRTHPSNINIILDITNKTNWANINIFIIPTQHITELTDRYTAHLDHAMPKLIQDIQNNFAGSQHEKMRIIRQAVPYLTRTDNNIFACIQDCVHILMNHYALRPST